MPKSPDKPKKPKDYARPTRAKAHRPDSPKHDPALDELLNPGISKGRAGMGSGTGNSMNLQPPPDNSFERRADRAAEHTARSSTPEGFREKPQSGYVARAPFDGPPVSGLDPALAKELGLEPDENAEMPGAQVGKRRF